MIVRTLALLSLILVLPPSLAAAAEPANQTAEPDVWPDHAVPDGDAARQGRSALPFTQGQIETLGRLLRQTQRASARGAGAPPQGRIRRIRLDGPGDGQIPVIALRRGYTTVLSFTGMTGAPWPIAETVLDSRFPAAGPGGRAGSGQSRRRPSALSGAPTGLSRRQRGGDAGWSCRAVGGRPARNRRRGRLPGRYPRCHARTERRSDLAGAARRVPRRRSGAARPARRRRAAGRRTACHRGRRPRRPRLEAGRRSAAGHPRISAIARPLGSRTRPRRPLGLPLAGHPAGACKRPGPRDPAFVPLNGNHNAITGHR